MIKIFVAYHIPARLINDPNFCPIHVGRALTMSTKDGDSTNKNRQWLLENCIGDDTGINISHLNRQYCELTGIFWVWKNINKYQDAEYIGFMHYRRHLRFNNQKAKEDKYGQIIYDKFNDQYTADNCLNSATVESFTKDFDIIIPKAWDVRSVGSKNLYDHYKSSSPYLHIKDYDHVLNILIQKYPEYETSIKKYNSGHCGFFTNMFVMKKTVFEQYCSWLFPILEEFDAETDISLYNSQEYRVDGYLSEWLFGIWLTHNCSSYKIRELQRTFIHDTKIITDDLLSPQFSEDSVNICMATDCNYVKYLAIAVQSIKSNITNNKKYDINILVPELPIRNQNFITALSDDNFKIRFFNVEDFIDRNYGEQLNIKGSGHITRATFYRLFIPKIFNAYSKVLYLDSDLIVNSDISGLFEYDISSKLIGGVRDVELIRWYLNDEFIRTYIDETLQIDNVLNYINSGVCLMNIDALNNFKFTEKAIGFLSKNAPLFHDQDVLNKLCSDKIEYFPLSWNVEYHIPIWSPGWKKQIPLPLLDPYIRSRNYPKIIHYAGGVKPWQDASVAMGQYFWSYARKSSLYEILIRDLIKYNKKEDSSGRSDIDKRFRSLIKYKYIFYNIAIKVTFNSSRKIKRGFNKYKALYESLND